MYSLSTIGAGLLALASFSSAIVPRQSGCTHGPTSRQCWSDGFDINTDFAEKFPDTGKVVKVSSSHDRSLVS